MIENWRIPLHPSARVDIVRPGVLPMSDGVSQVIHSVPAAVAAGLFAVVACGLVSLVLDVALLGALKLAEPGRNGRGTGTS